MNECIQADATLTHRVNQVNKRKAAVESARLRIDNIKKEVEV